MLTCIVSLLDRDLAPKVQGTALDWLSNLKLLKPDSLPWA